MKKTTLLPLGENILIQPEKPEQKTKAGIYLPETADQERSQLGTVIAVGESDKIKVKTGQKVIFRQYGGETIKVEGQEFLISNYKDVLAIVKA